MQLLQTASKFETKKYASVLYVKYCLWIYVSGNQWKRTVVVTIHPNYLVFSIRLDIYSLFAT